GVGFEPQVQELRRGVDIVVATPGRLLDHVQQKTIDLRQVEILVLDEADRMLDMGFIHDIRRVLALLPAKRQNLLFSATFPDEVRSLASGFMRDPVTVEVARRNMPIELIAQVAHPVDKDRKRQLLAHLVKSGNWQQVLVFCRTKHGANRLAEQLENDGIETAAIHGNKSQPQRMKALQRFKDGEQQVIPGFEVGSGYHSAQPEPQGRRGQQRQSQQRGQQRHDQPRNNQPPNNQQRQDQPRNNQQRQGQQRNNQQRQGQPRNNEQR